MKLIVIAIFGLFGFLFYGCSISSNLQNAGSNTVSASRTVSNGSLTFELLFMDQLYLSNGTQQEWLQAHQQPYIDAADQWLQVLTGIEGKKHHNLEIKIRVKHLAGGNGEAGPDSEEQVGDFFFPTSGEVIIGNHTYTEGFNPVEFHANIVHEFGHVIGIGTMTEDYTQYERKNKGYVFRVPNSKAVAIYNQVYRNSFDFVPFSDDGGHLYDCRLQDDKRRILSSGHELPSLTQEVMANGTLLGQVTLAVLDDIGYIVDYSQAQTYQPQKAEEP